MCWALAFPSWFGVVLLIWEAFGLCLPSIRQLLLPSLPFLVVYAALVIFLDYIAALPTLTIPDTVSLNV